MLFFRMVKPGTYSLLQLCSSTNNRHSLLFFCYSSLQGRGLQWPVLEWWNGLNILVGVGGRGSGSGQPRFDINNALTAQLPDVRND